MTEEDIYLVVMRLYQQAHRPTVREISRATNGEVSHSTVAALLKYRTIPVRWDKLEAIIEALGGDSAEVEPMWSKLGRRQMAPLVVKPKQDDLVASIDRLTDAINRLIEAMPSKES